MLELTLITRHAATVLVGQLAVMAYSVTDTIVAGRYSPQALAALSVASAIFITALRRLDYGNDEHVAHGFRAMARTMLAERLSGIPQDMVEAQLGHGKKGPLGSASR